MVFNMKNRRNKQTASYTIPVEPLPALKDDVWSFGHHAIATVAAELDAEARARFHGGALVIAVVEAAVRCESCDVAADEQRLYQTPIGEGAVALCWACAHRVTEHGVEVSEAVAHDCGCYTWCRCGHPTCSGCYPQCDR